MTKGPRNLRNYCQFGTGKEEAENRKGCAAGDVIEGKLRRGER